MSEAHTSAICPGQQSLLPGDHPCYLCVPVIVFYSDSAPNADEFYLHNYPLHPLNSDTREALCDEIKARLMHWQGATRVSRVQYFPFYGIELTDDQVAARGWRFIDGNQPLYAAPPPAMQTAASGEPT